MLGKRWEIYGSGLKISIMVNPSLSNHTIFYWKDENYEAKKVSTPKG